jgi:rhamnulokinase
MVPSRFLAFDIGAESGRAIVGTLEGGRLSLEEIHRFPNEPVEVRGTMYWDVLSLHNNVLKGLGAYVRRFGGSVDGIGIDTWGVDFGLLARDGALLQNPVHYRDRRTAGMADRVLRKIPPEKLFERSGQPLSPIQTLCQVLSLRLSKNPVLDSAATFLMMPDLFAYFLTDVRRCERTSAAVTQLYDVPAGQWSDEVFRVFDLPRSIMPEIVDSGTVLGELNESVKRGCGLSNAVVIAPCTYDTASAVAAVPGQGEGWAFISSGTWSIVGAMTERPVMSAEAYAAGLRNELALEGFFLCHNIMGLGILQQARSSWARQGETHSYTELAQLAEKAEAGGPLIRVDDPGFLAPTDMVAAIRDYCERTGQRPPEGPGAVTRCILESLACSYRFTLDALGRILGRRFEVLHIVGGGSLNTLLCQLTADITALRVVAGPSEAAACGNVLVQAMSRGAVGSAQEIRDVVRKSSVLVEYTPRNAPPSQELYLRHLGLRARTKK